MVGRSDRAMGESQSFANASNATGSPCCIAVATDEYQLLFEYLKHMFDQVKLENFFVPHYRNLCSCAHTLCQKFWVCVVNMCSMVFFAIQPYAGK